MNGTNQQLIPVEEQFRIMADCAPVMIWIADATGLCCFFNKGWLEYSGKSLEQESNNEWMKDIHPDDTDRFHVMYKIAFENKEEFRIEYRMKRYDGTYRWILNHGVPRYTSGKLFAGFIGSGTDIHDLKELEKHKDEFISAASHELKTPVTTTKVYLHILEEYFKKNNDNQYQQYAEKAGNQLNKLSKLINDLLDLSRINAKGLEFEEVVIPYGDLLNEVLTGFQNIASSHIIEYTGTANLKVMGDGERLSQALINLLSNAVKYSPNSKKISVHVSETEDEIITSVTDFGVGIPTIHHARIFERFYRVNATQKQTFPGLGIGLYITSEIIKRHGGNIWVNSEEGIQTTFTFALPIVKI